MIVPTRCTGRPAGVSFFKERCVRAPFTTKPCQAVALDVCCGLSSASFTAFTAERACGPGAFRALIPVCLILPAVDDPATASVKR